MIPVPRKPWFRQDDYAATLPEAIRHALSASAHERNASLTRACIMAAMYERDKWHATRFGSAPTSNLVTGLHIGHQRSIMDDRSVPGINKIKAAIDVQTDTILKQTPTLAARAAGARFEDMRQNEIRSAALNHAIQAPQSKGALYLWTRDGLVKREGFVRWLFRNGRLRLQRLQPWQVFYDAHDAEDGHLSQIHVVQLVDRDEFLAWYSQAKQQNDKGRAIAIPNHQTKIQEIKEIPRVHTVLPIADGFNVMWMGAHRWMVGDHVDTVSDQIRVIWSWKRAWRAGEPSGRAICTIMADSEGNHVGSSVTAIDMPFLRDSLPVVHWSPWQADQGIAGISLAEQLIGTQMCLDRTLFKLQRLQDKYGHPKLLVPEDTSDPIMKELLQAGVHAIRGGAETKHSWQPGLAISPSDIQWLTLLIDRPAAEIGISPSLTQGVSQLGPNASGVSRVEEALRSVDRQEGVRQAWQRGYLTAGSELLNTIDDALVVDKDFAANWLHAGRLVKRPWAKLTRPTGDYTLDVVDRGVLGDTPAGQLQQAQELAAQGILNQDSLADIIAGIPDLDGAMRRQTAPRRLIQHHLAILVDPDTTDEQVAEVQPSEDMDLADAAFLSTAELQIARANDAKPDTVIRLESYLLAVGAVVEGLAQRLAQPGIGVAPGAVLAPTAPLPEPDQGALPVA